MTATMPSADGVTTGLPLTIADATAALADGTLTSVELVQHAIEVADSHDGEVGVFIDRYNESALAAATAADAARAAGDPVGPLHGIPLGVKDIITTADGPTTAQSLVLDPAWGAGIGDAVVVHRLRAAGGVVMGKLTTMEFASGTPDHGRPFPIPRNPWDLARWPGGSSSGTGSGIASGMFLGGLGTDTGGSIRIPAAFCGVTGLMPTMGRVPKSGCAPLGYSLDHIGPLARSARDCAIMLGVLAGHDASDATSIDLPVDDYTVGLTGDLSGLRVGVDRVSGASVVEQDPALDELLDAAIAVLVARGAVVTDVRLPRHAEAMPALMAIVAGESLAYHLPDAQSRIEDFSPSVQRSLAGGSLYSGADYVQAQRARRLIHRECSALYDDVDLVLTPTSWVGALPVDGLAQDTSWIGSVNTPYWDLTGNPVVSVPIGFTADGLPLAMQLAGRPFDEATVLRAADAYQQDTDWHLAQPALVTT